MKPASAQPRIALAHPKLSRGGSEGALMWAADALWREYRVTIITTGEADLDALNAYYGTAAPPDRVHVDRAPMPAVLARSSRAAALRGFRHQRHCQKTAARYDVLFSAYNICDFGRPAIQRVADFSWDPDVRVHTDPAGTGSRHGFHERNVLNRLYLGVCRMISPPSGRDLFAEDLFIANSRWTASVLKEKYRAAHVRMIYPPVYGGYPDVPWTERVPDFVCLGRISREKRIDTMIDILARVRQKGHSIQFHIIGEADGSSYAREIEALARKHADWVHLSGEQHGENKRRLLTSNRYALHACPFEGFGIAVAEMARAGCLPFVPATGGVPEIVDHETNLCWTTPDEAAHKIDTVLKSEPLQETLRRRVRQTAQRFHTHAYQQAIRDAVTEMQESGKMPDS